jgi:hypothetical protein
MPCGVLHAPLCEFTEGPLSRIAAGALVALYRNVVKRVLMYRIESELIEVALEDLRPTQITVGFKEVDAKRKSWAKLDDADRKKAMGDEFFPAVRGPGGKFFVLDRHHAALALSREKAECVRVGLVRDLSALSSENFWIFLDHYSWMHCYDAKGKRRPLDKVPKRFEGMQNDPYRSLAGELRDHGGYSKVDVPFLEFLWANYLRRQVPQRQLKEDPKKALSKALKLASSKECSFLPGWCGKV